MHSLTKDNIQTSVTTLEDSGKMQWHWSSLFNIQSKQKGNKFVLNLKKKRCQHTKFVVAVVYLLSSVTPWTVAHKAPLSMQCSRQEYWSGLPFPSPGDFSDLGIEPMSPALAGRCFITESPRKP